MLYSHGFLLRFWLNLINGCLFTNSSNLTPRIDVISVRKCITHMTIIMPFDSLQKLKGKSRAIRINICVQVSFIIGKRMVGPFFDVFVFIF